MSGLMGSRLNVICIIFATICIIFNLTVFMNSRDNAAIEEQNISMMHEEENAHVMAELQELKTLLRSANQYSASISTLLMDVMEKSETGQKNRAEISSQLSEIMSSVEADKKEWEARDQPGELKVDKVSKDPDNVIMPFEDPEKQPDGSTCPSVTDFLAENTIRKQLLESKCTEYSKYNAKLNNNFENFYFSKSKLSWCPVYKAASSNVFAHFCEGYFPTSSCHDKTVNGAAMYRKGGKFREPSSLNGGKRFIVVRDPFTRLLSSYRDKFEFYREPAYKLQVKEMMIYHRKLRWTREFNRFKAFDEAVGHANTMHANTKKSTKTKVALNPTNIYDHPPYPTFFEFISEVIAGMSNEHWTPASQFCGACGSKKFDYVVKTEDFTCEFNNMLNATNNNDLTAHYQEYWATNKGPPVDPSLFYRYYSSLTLDQLDDVLLLYSGDCEFYGYDCAATVRKIKLFKLANPNYVHKYTEIWDTKL